MGLADPPKTGGPIDGDTIDMNATCILPHLEDAKGEQGLGHTALAAMGEGQHDGENQPRAFKGHNGKTARQRRGTGHTATPTTATGNTHAHMNKSSPLAEG